MADRTKIEWADATWNPITGCQIVSEGCRNCYAMTLAGTRLAHVASRAGLTRQNAQGKHVWTGETRFNRDTLDQPLRWKRPRRIFVCAHGDLFAESVPNDWIDQVFAIMALAPQHQFQVLTKRPERMREYLTALLTEFDQMVGWTVRFRNAARKAGALLGDMTALRATTWPLPNVWLGVSVEDQATADARIPHLLSTPAAVRWISAEPLLGPVDLQHFCDPDFDTWLSRLDWVVVGGESGPGARPMHPDWARSLRDQCADAGVPFFFKQWGEWSPCCIHDEKRVDDDCFELGPAYPLAGCAPDGVHTSTQPALFWQNGEWVQWPLIEEVPAIGARRVGKARAGRTLDGITHDAWPEVAG